jgi:hypothetical protein
VGELETLKVSVAGCYQRKVVVEHVAITCEFAKRSGLMTHHKKTGEASQAYA